MSQFLLFVAAVSLSTASIASAASVPPVIRAAAVKATNIPGKVRVSGFDNMRPWGTPGSRNYASDAWTVGVKKGTGGKGQEFQNMFISSTGKLLEKEPVQKNVGRATGD